MDDKVDGAGLMRWFVVVVVSGLLFSVLLVCYLVFFYDAEYHIVGDVACIDIVREGKTRALYVVTFSNTSDVDGLVVGFVYTGYACLYDYLFKRVDICYVVEGGDCVIRSVSCV